MRAAFTFKYGLPEAKFLQIQLVNENINNSYRIICCSLLLQCTKIGLLPVCSLYVLHENIETKSVQLSFYSHDVYI